MRVIKLNKKNIKHILEKIKLILVNDGLVVFPSDTVYGLAANALSLTAVKKLLEFKQRPKEQSISVVVKNFKQAKQFVVISLNQQNILKTLLPGPYTIVLPSKHKVIKKLEAEDKTLGIRFPDYWFTQALSKAFPFPYTATSANLHGKGPHYSINSLLNTLSGKKKKLLDLVIDYGILPRHLPSTVINLSQPNLPCLRKGDFQFRLIKKCVSINEDQTKQIAKDLLKKNLSILKEKSLIFVLQGDLGTGKTIFVKGLGEFLGINNIVSPTFVLYYEYSTKHKFINKLHHFDLYRAKTKQDLKVLEIEKLLKPKNLLVFEWGEKISSIFSLLKANKAKILLVSLKEISAEQRKIIVYKL